MDTFFEQIVAVRKTAKSLLGLFGIWLLALIISIAAFLFLGSFGLLFVAGAIFGAYKLSGFFSIEYEYIITNGEMDIDKIIAKSSRKRMANFNLAKVETVEKFNIAAKPAGNFEKTVIACNGDEDNAYYMIVSEEGKGRTLIVFAPDDRIKGAIVKFIPKFIANSAFK